MQVAAQLYTLREFTSTPEGFYDSLKRCKAIGYDGVQLSAVGCMGGPSPLVNASTAKTWLDELGLQCCATHRSWNLLAGDLESEIAFHRELDCSYVAVPGIGSEFGVDAASYKNFLRQAEPIAAELLKHGIKFGYHNHAHEFARNPETGRPCIEILTEPQYGWLEMEVDTYWVADAGVCPANFLERCRGRIFAVHLKDREVIAGEGAVMAPVGFGNLNWDTILEACRSGGTGWLIVEQDTCRTDPFECLQASYQFLLSARLA